MRRQVKYLPPYAAMNSMKELFSDVLQDLDIALEEGDIEAAENA